MSRVPPAFQSYSVPSSPAISRSSKHSPVTPQRAHRQSHRQSLSLHRSPLTPLTPYSPLSLHSLDSAHSSTLTTPDNFSLSLKAGNDKNRPDVVANWRNRASENGIRVSSNDQNIDSEATDFSVSDASSDSNLFSSEALLPAFLSSQSENLFSHATPARARAHSQNLSVPPSHSLSPTLRRNQGRPQMPVSPLRSRQSQNQPVNLLSTPPPNRNLVKQLKLKGSLTDPAHTRRREAFGDIRTPQNPHNTFNFGCSNDMSMELFDIDEHEYEQETNYDMPHEDESFSQNLQAHQVNTFGYLNSTCPSFPQYNSDPFQTTGIQFGYTPAPNIADSVEHHFHSFQQQQRRQNSHRYDIQSHHPQAYRDTLRQFQQMNPISSYVRPVQIPVPSADLSLPTIHKPIPQHPPRNATSMILPPASNLASPEISGSSDCSVCLSQNASSLAILKPCGHPLCSACLTSALNIVGEKDMECAVCKQSVQDFKLIVSPKAKGGSAPDRKDTIPIKSFFDPLFSSPSSSNTAEGLGILPENDSFGDLEASFDFGLDFSSNEIRASTPKLENSLSTDSSALLPSHVSNAVVLRIDNVPWDITPSQVVTWLQQPVERVHVLLDSKGKTLSHAYVEIKDQQVAGAILRGEATGPDGRKKERGSVLGRGRRARGVTITRSGQEELMADLFPRWRGAFDGSRPSLVGLQGERIIGALEGGILTENEVTGLLYLIREPDSHFLKVPSLPFHSLISILSKFPVDIDSRVFWSAGVRDMLFDVAFAAVETLLGRLEALKEEVNPKHGYSMDLVTDLVQTIARCQAFTAQQIEKIITFASSKSISVSSPVIESEPLQLPATSNTTAIGTPSSSSTAMTQAPRDEIKNQTGQHFMDLAQEFGVEAELVQALAQRLAILT